MFNLAEKLLVDMQTLKLAYMYIQQSLERDYGKKTGCRFSTIKRGSSLAQNLKERFLVDLRPYREILASEGGVSAACRASERDLWTLNNIFRSDSWRTNS